MINFFVTGADSTCIREYLRKWGQPLADRMVIHEYESLGATDSLTPAATIFAGMDRAAAAALDAAVAVHDQLLQAVPGSALLNHPRKSLGRFDLLAKLYAEGYNRFRAIRARDDPAELRFPVFIRRENDHTGSLTELLHDRRAVDRALWQVRLRGFPLDDLVIIEFCDTRDDKGRFRKYSAMRIGDAIIPRYLHVSDHWVTKDDVAYVDEALVDEEHRYLNGHAHDRWLREVFDLAQIRYGRIDYSLYRGDPQVWEINTNPILGRQPGHAMQGDDPRRKLRAPARAFTHRRMLEAFRNLDTVGERGRMPIVIAPAIRERLAAENAQLAGKAANWLRSSLRRHPRTKQVAKRVMSTAASAAAPMLVRLFPHWSATRGRRARAHQPTSQ